MDAEEVREENSATLRGSRQENGESKDDGNDVSGKGVTARMHLPCTGDAARCVGGCGAPNFAGWSVTRGSCSGSLGRSYGQRGCAVPFAMIWSVLSP